MVSSDERAMQNRVFFPQLLLDQWGVEGKIDLTATELVVIAEGRRYTIAEAVHVIAEATGAEDPHGLVGKVKARSVLDELSAEIFESSMLIGDNAYDVAPGWVATPTTPFAEHLLSQERMAARGNRTDVGTTPVSEEDMLRRFLEGTL